MNSARVAGGAAPLPEHWIVEEPQSPVKQVNLPVVASGVQRVRPHKRPDQEAGTEMVFDSPGWRAKPVVGSCGMPAFESMPGQTW